MSLAEIVTPVIYCSEYPDCSKVEVELPFGLPSFSFDNPCCEGLNITLDQLEGLLRPLIPFLKLLECAVKLISIVIAVPEAIGPPPDPGKIVEMAEAIADFLTKCLPYILSLIPILPTAIIAFCKMIRGIARLLLTILRCLKKVFVINISIAGDVLTLDASIDPLLKGLSSCLADQAATLRNSLLDKLGALLNTFTLLNMLFEVLFTFIPPLKQAMEDQGLYPITPDMSKGVMPPSLGTSLDTLITIFTFIEAATNICAGGD